MRRVLLITAALAGLAACAPTPYAPVTAYDPYGAGAHGNPVFADWPMQEAYAREAVAPDFDEDSEFIHYSPQIWAGSKLGARFAGHVAVASWRCGPRCVQYAFVDARDGSVHWGPTAEFGAAFSYDSRLFILDPPELVPPQADVRPRFYVWDGNDLDPYEEYERL
jgi:hypothetical protein